VNGISAQTDSWLIMQFNFDVAQ